ncbi:MAG: R3H domain-containing nucleic acid-binding protein [bacterium]|nr:R3H domain-containing nucleic acid-binding protein [bacterium]
MIDEIKKIIQDFCEAGGIDVRDIQAQSDIAAQTLTVNLIMDEAGPFIGERGANLKDLESILRQIVKKRFPSAPSVFFDVNGYRREREESLRAMARQAAKEAVLRKEPVMLEPMNAYERRLVHIELSTRPDVITESIGQDSGRRVVVKPYS